MGEFKMRVAFKQIRAGSGSDVWIRNMVKGLGEMGVESGVEFYPHRYQMFPHILKFLGKESDYDIIQSPSWCGFAFKEKDIPLIITGHHVVHDPIYSKYKTLTQRVGHKLIYHYEKKSIESADEVISVSDYTKRMLREVFGCDSVRIYNGIDDTVFRPTDVDREGYEGKTVLLFAGNVINRKGADILPKIMKKLGDDFILLCTSGLRRNFVKSKGNIKMIGCVTQQQLVEYYNLCDIFLFPSRLEGFGLSVAEAMSCGKPIICTDCSALPELVIDGMGGYLCEMDNIGEFIDKIKLLSADEHLMKQMGEFNRDRILRYFTLNRMCEEYLEVYNRLLK